MKETNLNQATNCARRSVKKWLATGAIALAALAGSSEVFDADAGTGNFIPTLRADEQSPAQKRAADLRYKATKQDEKARSYEERGNARAAAKCRAQADKLRTQANRLDPERAEGGGGDGPKKFIRCYVQDAQLPRDDSDLNRALRDMLAAKPIKDIKVVMSVPSIKAAGRGAYRPDSAVFNHSDKTAQRTQGDYSDEQDFRKNVYKFFERELHRRGVNVRNTFYTDTPGDYHIEQAEKAGAELIFVVEFQPKFSYVRFFVDADGKSYGVQGKTLTVPFNSVELNIIRVADNSKCGTFILSHAKKMDEYPFFANGTRYTTEIGQDKSPSLQWKAPPAEETARFFAEKIGETFQREVRDR